MGVLVEKGKNDRRFFSVVKKRCKCLVGQMGKSGYNRGSGGGGGGFVEVNGDLIIAGGGGGGSSSGEQRNEGVTDECGTPGDNDGFGGCNGQGGER